MKIINLLSNWRYNNFFLFQKLWIMGRLFFPFLQAVHVHNWNWPLCSYFLCLTYQMNSHDHIMHSPKHEQAAGHTHTGSELHSSAAVVHSVVAYLRCANCTEFSLKQTQQKVIVLMPTFLHYIFAWLEKLEIQGSLLRCISF